MLAVVTIFAAFVAASIITPFAVYSAPVRADSAASPATLRVLAVGDSITVGYGDPTGQAWRGEFAALAAAAGTTVQIDVYAAGGWSTADALPGLVAALVATKPDLVVVMLGTNDAADPTLTGFEVRYGLVLADILDASSASVAPVFVQYSTSTALPHLAGGEGGANDAIYRCSYARGWLASPPAPRLAGIIDLQGLSPSLLSADGIHPTAAPAGGGYAVIGRQVYRGVREAYGWPAIPAEPGTSMMGHRP
jgi:lysophospholipase L1-like esterase